MVGPAAQTVRSLLVLMVASGVTGLVHWGLRPPTLDPASKLATPAGAGTGSGTGASPEAAKPGPVAAAATGTGQTGGPSAQANPAQANAQGAHAGLASHAGQGGAGQAGADGFMLKIDRVLELVARQQSQGDVVFVDARGPAEFAAGHIPSAFNIGPDAFYGGQYPPALDEIPKSYIVVVYCGGGECDASKLVALRLKEAGFERLHIYEDGFTGWSAGNHPIAKGGS